MSMLPRYPPPSLLPPDLPRDGMEGAQVCAPVGTRPNKRLKRELAYLLRGIFVFGPHTRDGCFDITRVVVSSRQIRAGSTVPQRKVKRKNKSHRSSLVV